MKRHIDSIKGPNKAASESEPATPQETETAPVAPEEPAAIPEETPQPVAEEPEEPVVEEISSPPEKEDSFESLFPEPTVAIAGPPGWIWWTLLFIALAVMGFVGYNLFHNQDTAATSTRETATALPTATDITEATPESTLEPTATPESTATPAATATLTPTATATGVVKSAVTLRVLNGTTTAGEAAKAQTVLEKAGFTVRTIGNANNRTYASTVIYYQSGRKAEATAVQSALKGYQTSLEQSSLADPDMVLVVIGTK